MKKTWFKSKIESSTMKESEDSFNMWVSLARKEMLKTLSTSSEMTKPEKLDMRRASTDLPQPIVAAEQSNNKPAQEKQASPRRRFSIALRSGLGGLSSYASSLDLVAITGAIFFFVLLWIVTYLFPADVTSLPFLVMFSLLIFKILSLERRMSVLEKKNAAKKE